MAKTRGRPRVEGQTKTCGLDVRVTESERQAFKRAAEIAGLSLSAWVCERLRQVARKELQAVGEPVPFFEVRPKRETNP